MGILNFGKIVNDQYQNDLINWSLQIPSNYKAKLKTLEERKDFHERIIQRFWFDSKEEKKEVLS